MTDLSAPARADVLAFYKDLPFNYRAAAADHAAAVRRADSLRAYPPLVDVLKARPRLLDVGCGAGWLVNSAAYHHRCAATGIDFNPVAVERATAVAHELRIDACFAVADLFTYASDKPFDVVTSVGVLHHTNDCLGGLRHIASLVAPRGYLFVGLYHAHGRRPFLDHFATLAGNGEEAQFAEFARLAKSSGTWGEDETYLRSWFRDQVLHPHETQHTLAELFPVFDQLGFTVRATSVNRFASLPARADLIAAETALGEAGRKALAEARYFPGFFVVLAQRD